MGRNIVELLSALASQGSAALGRLRLLDESHLGELLQDVTVDLASTQSEVGWSTTESLGTSEDLLQSTDTNVGSDVHTTSDSSGANVQPVGVIGGELLEGSGLDDVNPLGKRTYYEALIETRHTFGISNFPWVFRCLE